MGGALVAVFCWRELARSPAVPLLLLGFVVGGMPLILYTLHAPPGQNPLSIALSLQSGSGLPRGADLVAKRLAGTFLWSLPLATGLSPACVVTEMPLYGPADAHTLPCVLVQGTWSLGYLLLLGAAILLAVQGIRTYLAVRRLPRAAWTEEDRRALVIQVARLALLLCAVIPLALYLKSPLSGLKPWSTRYLIGLLVAFPAVLWPLWRGARVEEMRLPSALRLWDRIGRAPDQERASRPPTGMPASRSASGVAPAAADGRGHPALASSPPASRTPPGSRVSPVAADWQRASRLPPSPPAAETHRHACTALPTLHRPRSLCTPARYGNQA
jgi:hypothetical protein